MKYAITGATGNFGQSAVKALVDKVGTSSVIAIARNTEKAEKVLPVDVEIRVADYGNEESLEKAFADIDKLLFISSQPSGEVSRGKQHENVVTALKNAGVNYVAYTSFPKADISKAGLAIDHCLTENLIKQSGVAHSFLRNNWYLENEAAFLQSGAAGQTATYWANGTAGWALEREFAQAAVNVLTSDNTKEIYEFSGPARTYEDLGKALKEATGKDFEIKQVTEDEYTVLLEKTGLPHDVAAMYASFQEPIDDGSLTNDSTDLENILGSLTPLTEAIKEILAR